MASACSILSEDKFLCSICLEVFTQPVSTPCGHNFCLECIRMYWERNQICQCPFCKKTFASRPELHVNTVMSELAADFAKMTQEKTSTSDPSPQEQAVILCDICSEIKHKAVKSCLVCLTSFCEAHLEPHQRVPVLKSHKLIEPISNLDEKLCQKHSKLKELFCRTNEAFICVMCFKTDHRSHNVVSVEEEYEAMMVEKDKVLTDLQSRIHSTCDKISQIEIAIDVSKKEAEMEKESTVQVFDDCVSCLQKNKAELVEVIEERQRAANQKAEGFLEQLRTQVTELKSKSSELEQLSKYEDHHCFLQNFSALLLPAEKDWTNMSVKPDMGFTVVRQAMTQVKQKADEIMKLVPELKKRRWGEDVTTDTAQESGFMIQDGQVVKGLEVDVSLDTAKKMFVTNKDRRQVVREPVAKDILDMEKQLFVINKDRKQVAREPVVGVTLVAEKKMPRMHSERNSGAIVIEEDFPSYPKKTTKPKSKKPIQYIGVHYSDWN